MLRFVVILILLTGLFNPTPQYGPPGPVRSNPICEYVYSDQWPEVYEHIINKEDFWNRITWRFSKPCYLNECLYAEVLPYNTNIIWHFSQSFTDLDEIYIVLVNQDYIITNILEGTPLPDGSVLFDFSTVAGGTYYFFEISTLEN